MVPFLFLSRTSEDAWETAPDRGEWSEGCALGFIIQGYWFPSTSNYHSLAYGTNTNESERKMGNREIGWESERGKW